MTGKTTDKDLISRISKVKKVAIIGAGVAGVVTARVLAAEGIECVVFEKQEAVGGVWNDGYLGFGIQVNAWLYEFPDMPLPRGYDFAAGEMVQHYTQQYAQANGVLELVKFNTVVKTVTEDKDNWSVTYSANGAADVTETYDYVVIATGVYSPANPHIPKAAGMEDTPVEFVHANDFKDIAMAKGKKCVTVGYGKSAFDCAQAAAKVAEKSTLLYRSLHWPVPRNLLGVVPFEWGTFSRFGQSLLPPYHTQGPIETALHSPVGKPLVNGFWRLLEVLLRKQQSLDPKPGTPATEADLVPKIKVEEDLYGGHGIIPHPSFFDLVRCGLIAPKNGSIKKYNKDKSIELADGTKVEADIVFYGTGFVRPFEFLPAKVKKMESDKNGFFMWRQMLLPGVKNMCFLNCNVTTFTNITTASIQARWLAEMLAGRVEVPGDKEMEAQIEQEKGWRQETMPRAGGAQGYLIQLHQTHYWDQLLKDFGANPKRKRSVFPPLRAAAEVLVPYTARDYDTIVTGTFRDNPAEVLPVGTPINFLPEFGWMMMPIFYFFLPFWMFFLVLLGFVGFTFTLGTR